MFVVAAEWERRLGKNGAMEDFRCYVGDPDGRVVFGMDVTAADLDAAKREAYELLREKHECSLHAVHGIEMW
jgi:hypothetical protein